MIEKGERVVKTEQNDGELDGWSATEEWKS